MSGPHILERLMVPLDGSRLAECVLPLVTRLAGDLHARICLLHIVEDHPPPAVHGEPHLAAAGDARAYLEGVAARLAPGLPVEQHVHGTEERDVAGSIAAHVGELGADLIVLCMHGPSDLRRVMLGSVGQKVGRRTTIPILLVGPQGAPGTPLRTLLVPLDGTAEGDAALPLAAEIARATGATLRLVRVVPTVGTLTGDQAAASRLIPIATAAALDEAAEEACTFLGARVAELAAAGVRAHGEVCRGDTIHELADAAARASADLIVLATHGRSGLGAVWTGSVAAGLARHVPQPLLLVRIPLRPGVGPT